MFDHNIRNINSAKYYLIFSIFKKIIFTVQKGCPSSRHEDICYFIHERKRSLYPFHRWLCGYHSCSEFFGEDILYLTLPGIEVRFLGQPASVLGTVLPEVCQLSSLSMCIKMYKSTRTHKMLNSQSPCCVYLLIVRLIF